MPEPHRQFSPNKAPQQQKRQTRTMLQEVPNQKPCRASHHRYAASTKRQARWKTVQGVEGRHRPTYVQPEQTTLIAMNDHEKCTAA
jgi:hypothetical protein